MIPIPLSYGDLDFHQKIGRIIKEHSENKQNIREIVLNAVDPEAVNTILDLGCGYGWFEEALVGEFGLIVGIEYVKRNKGRFLSITEKIAKKSVFLSMRLPCPIAMPSDYFDLIVSAYSLYFFPDIIPEVKRMLSPEGTFVIITHSESMLEEGERHFHFKNLRKLIERFSSENGEAILREHFGHIEHIDYSNNLVFDKDGADELADYINFKREFISLDAHPEAVKEKLLYELKEKGTLRLNKNDRIFLVQK